MKNNRKTILITVCITVLVLSVGYRLQPQECSPSLLFLCGAGMQAPVAEIVRNFEQETGIKVQIHFDGSSILREYISTFKAGDLYLPGDKNNLDTLQEQGLIAKSSFLAWHIGALLIAPRYQGHITGLDDLAGGNVRLAMSNPRQTSLGRLVMERVISKHPAGGEILENITAYGSSSLEMLKLYREGLVDVLFEWDALAQIPEGQGLIAVPIEEPYRIQDPIYAGLLKTSRNPALAGRFFSYLTTEGRGIFQQYGYNVED